MKKIITFLVVLSILVSGLCVAAAPKAEDFTAKAAILMEASTGKILYEYNKDEKLAMASITKLMPVLITMEKLAAGEITLDTQITGSPKAKEAGGSTIFLDVGEKMALNDIIKGICIASGNDATIALAETLAGSEADFVSVMNQRASELGMTNTNYVNVTGFDADYHYTSAYDTALLAKELITKHPEILNYTTIREEWLRGNRTQLINTNRLLSTYQYTTGLKTGTETNAKYCVVATAKKDNMDLIAVILGAEDGNARFAEAKMLLQYGYSAYELSHPVEDNELVGTVTVNKGAKDTVNAIIKNPSGVVVPKTYSDNIKKDVTLFKDVPAPIKAGDIVGEMVISAAGEPITTIPVVAAEDVNKLNFWQAIWKIFTALFQF
ncbi:MAG: D-alanyl-D-alanine carboxypeptidase [Clostridia bacterium]|nr:D-alanyl-D-alanine carboxypeptidase [Clostridia bacterium]MBR2972822.1 D-alanyl-D-alanine carboxypeptidase [Clostridia bacterium]MBR3576450.1 D-alanyl-D-alanine carboxypeptidase [Clostridia bacterium]